MIHLYGNTCPFCNKQMDNQSQTEYYHAGVPSHVTVRYNCKCKNKFGRHLRYSVSNTKAHVMYEFFNTRSFQIHQDFIGFSFEGGKITNRDNSLPYKVLELFEKFPYFSSDEEVRNFLILK